MFIASVVAVILSGSALIAVTVFADGAGGGGGDGTGNCVPGGWRVREYREDGPFGSAEMVAGTPTFVFNDDGTGVAEFGPDVRMAVEVAFVGSVDAAVAGRIDYRYETTGEAIEFVEQDSTAQLSSELEVPYEDVLTLPEGPLDYTCDGDVMTFTDGEQAFELQRAG